MTEQERVDKLKARMSRWQEYVDKPHTNALQPNEDNTETKTREHEPRTGLNEEWSRSDTLPKPVQALTYVRGDGRDDLPVPDRLSEVQEARIADLKTVLAREQEQADRLADEVRRAQYLHAATLYTHIAEERTRDVQPLHAPRQIPEMPSMYDDGARRKNLALMIGILLAITSACILGFLLTR